MVDAQIHPFQIFRQACPKQLLVGNIHAHHKRRGERLLLQPCKQILKFFWNRIAAPEPGLLSKLAKAPQQCRSTAQSISVRRLVAQDEDVIGLQQPLGGGMQGNIHGNHSFKSLRILEILALYSMESVALKINSGTWRSLS